jgi:hypothetical protein
MLLPLSVEAISTAQLLGRILSDSDYVPRTLIALPVVSYCKRLSVYK